MSQPTHFSPEQKFEIKSIVQVELIPIKDQLDRLTEKVVENSEDIRDIKEKMENMPTKQFILDVLDATAAEREEMRLELAMQGSLVQKHDKDIHVIKTHLQLQT